MNEIQLRKRGTLTLQQFPSNYSDRVLRVRKAYKQVIDEKEYKGWSDRYDRQFDDASAFFCVLRNDEDIIGTCRVVEKQGAEPLPLEKARVTDSNLSLRIDPDLPSAELTWFWFESTVSLKALVSALAEFSAPRYNVVYATFDPALELDRLYRYLNFREIHEGLRVTYDGFTRHGELVEWSVMRIVNDDIEELTLRKQFSPDHFTSV